MTFLLILSKTRYSQVYGQLQQLKQHADGEANPDPQGATDGGDESGEAVSGNETADAIADAVGKTV